MKTMVLLRGGFRAARAAGDLSRDALLRGWAGADAALATFRPGRAAARLSVRASGTVAAGFWFALLASQPARADIIAEWGSEMFTWISTLDTDILPLGITAGLMASLIAAAFSRLAGVGVFIFTVAGAFIYGTRDDLLSVAGGGGL